MADQSADRKKLVMAAKAAALLLAGFAAGYAARKAWQHRHDAEKDQRVTVTLLRHRAINGALGRGATTYSFTTDFAPPLGQN
ncbi:MAG: hypothetical protein WC421_04910 [Elusimicrobiales bacterium]